MNLTGQRGRGMFSEFLKACVFGDVSVIGFVVLRYRVLCPGLGEATFTSFIISWS